MYKSWIVLICELASLFQSACPPTPPKSGVFIHSSADILGEKLKVLAVTTAELFGGQRRAIEVFRSRNSRGFKYKQKSVAAALHSSPLRLQLMFYIAEILCQFLLETHHKINWTQKCKVVNDSLT